MHALALGSRDDRRRRRERQRPPLKHASGLTWDKQSVYRTAHTCMHTRETVTQTHVQHCLSHCNIAGMAPNARVRVYTNTTQAATPLTPPKYARSRKQKHSLH